MCHMPNIDAISGALITLSLNILILDSQCEEGARDDIDIWYMGIIRVYAKTFHPHGILPIYRQTI